MYFEIVEIKELSGEKCTIYKILQKDGSTLFENFLTRHYRIYSKEVNDIISRIKSIADYYGARPDYFKLNYGNPGDGVCALYDDENKKLRLMCVHFPNVVIILGGGGSKNVRAYQDDSYLKEKVDELKIISSLITKRIRNKEIIWSKDKTKLEGDLKFNID